MLLSAEYIRLSLETNLYFGRNMKEHAFFLQTTFTPRDPIYSNKADVLRRVPDTFLSAA